MGERSYANLAKANLIKKIQHSKRNRLIFETLGTLAYPVHIICFSQQEAP